MPNQSPRRHVTFLISLRNELTYPLVQSVLGYGDHTGRWRFIGLGTTPFITPERLGELEVDGLIGLIDSEEVARRAVACCGAVVNIVTDQPDVQLPAVGNDDAAIGRLGAEHLLERGFAALGFVGDRESPGGRRRRDAFRSVVEEAGRTCHVFETFWGEGPAPREKIASWLMGVPRPIGVLAFIDHYARLTIEAALRLGLRVPDDVAVLGVNNNPWAVGLSGVAMSSIELDMPQIGLRAAKLLEGLMSGEAPPPPQHVPPRGVVVRRSTDIVLSEDPLVTGALRYIHDHIAAGLNVDDVLGTVGVSRSTLVNRMKQALGYTPHEAICRARIEQVKLLLVNTDQTIDQIARRCGFVRQPRLNEMFKRLTGLTPGQYRRQSRR